MGCALQQKGLDGNVYSVLHDRCFSALGMGMSSGLDVNFRSNAVSFGWSAHLFLQWSHSASIPDHPTYWNSVILYQHIYEAGANKSSCYARFVRHRRHTSTKCLLHRESGGICLLCNPFKSTQKEWRKGMLTVSSSISDLTHQLGTFSLAISLQSGWAPFTCKFPPYIILLPIEIPDRGGMEKCISCIVLFGSLLSLHHGRLLFFP